MTMIWQDLAAVTKPIPQKSEVKKSKLPSYLKKTTGHNISKNDTAEGMCFVYFMLTMLVLKCGDVGYGCIATHV